MSYIETTDPTYIALLGSIQTGDTDKLKSLLVGDPALAKARFGSEGMSRSSLHLATDWPGNFPNVADTIAILIAAGAEIDARFEGNHTETALHWAASSDDIPALNALLDAGADIEADGAVIAGGTPMFDAVAFVNWKAARRLLERGAKTTRPQAAALGLLDRLKHDPPSEDDINQALWSACHGGQRETAEYLLELGADINWVPHWERLTPLDAAQRSNAAFVVEWLQNNGARSALDLA